MNLNRTHATRSLGPTALLGLLLLIFLSLATAVFGQTQVKGSLTGVVSNRATGQVLEGAKVVLSDGSSTITGPDGSYEFRGVPQGETLVTVVYPGLDAATEKITVGADGVVRDFRMTAEIYMLDTMVVSSQREGNAASIARQESSLLVESKISVDAFGNVAKGDMGSFLQRLPGVVGEYGGSAVDAVSVRGLASEFTGVMMDGTRVASANPDSRSQLVSGLPADAIESVEVIKTPTAVMDADSLGGVVNLRTRSGFDRTHRTIVLNASGTYNQSMGGYLDPEGRARTIYPNFSFDISDVYMLFGRKLGVAVTGGYQEVGDGLQTIRAEFAGNWDYQKPTTARRVVYADQEYHKNTRTNLMTKFDYKLSKNSSITLAVGYTKFRNEMQQVRPQYTDNLTIDTANSTEDLWIFSRVRHRTQRDYRDTPAETGRLQLNGKHSLGAYRITWELTYSDSWRPLTRMSASARSNNDFGMIYDRTKSKAFPTLTFTTGTPPPLDTFNNLNSIAVTGTHENASDTIKGARLDASRDFAKWTVPVKFTTGFRVRQEDRDRDYDELSGSMPAGNYGKYRDFSFTHGWLDGRYPATPLINTKLLFSDAGIAYLPSGLPARPTVQFAYNSTFFPASLDASANNSLLNDYQTRETIPAGYFQSEVGLLKNLKMTAGVRVEQTRAEITSRLDDTKFSVAELRYGKFKTIDSKYTDVFPNLQFRYEPIAHFVLRAAYSTTIGRPRISDLVGRFSVNEIGQSVSFSNPSLKPQRSSNIDLSAEYYFQPVGVVSVGAFRKDIKNYVVATSFQIKGNEFGLDLADYVGWTGNSRVNSGDGKVEGMEFNYSQQFRFLPGPLKGIGAMANWTVLTSSGDYNGIVSSLPFKNYLVGLRPRSGNAGLTYTHGPLDLRLMFNYAASYIASLDNSDPSNSEFIGSRYQFDFFARYKLSRNLNFFVDVVNLTEEYRARYRGIVRNDRWAQTNLFPRVITAGVQARF